MKTSDVANSLNEGCGCGKKRPPTPPQLPPPVPKPRVSNPPPKKK